MTTESSGAQRPARDAAAAAQCTSSSLLTTVTHNAVRLDACCWIPRQLRVATDTSSAPRSRCSAWRPAWCCCWPPPQDGQHCGAVARQVCSSTMRPASTPIGEEERAHPTVDAALAGLHGAVVGLHHEQGGQHAHRAPAEAGHYGIHLCQLLRQVHAAYELRVRGAWTARSSLGSMYSFKPERPVAAGTDAGGLPQASCSRRCKTRPSAGARPLVRPCCCRAAPSASVLWRDLAEDC